MDKNAREDNWMDLARSVYDAHHQRITDMDQMSLNCAIAVVPGILLTLWYATSHTGPSSTRIYQILPLLLCLFTSYFAYIRASASCHAKELVRLEKFLQAHVGLVPSPFMQTSLNRSMTFSERLPLLLAFWGIAFTATIGIFLWCVIQAYLLENAIHIRLSVLCGHLFLILVCILVCILASKIAYRNHLALQGNDLAQQNTP